MYWALSIAAAFLLLFAVAMVWGGIHLRHSRKKAQQEIARIDLADIEPLTKECVKVFQQRLGVRLNLNDCEDTAQKLDDAFRDMYKLKGAFARERFYWYFVKPVGACLGDLLRLHARHEWFKEPGQPPGMRLRLLNGESTVSPFEKVMKHSMGGEPGDLLAYVTFAREMDRAADRGDRQDGSETEPS
jgi:hypothetical protein